MTPSLKAPEEIRIEVWPAAAAEAESVDAEIDMLAEVLRAVIYAGAGISFVAPFSMDEASAYWIHKVLAPVRAGTRRAVVAWLNERIVGTVQLDLDTPPNQPHRAGIAKLLVHPDARRRGIARALMVAIEEIARAEGRTLLTLDTVEGSYAEALYRSLGFIAAGIIPRYSCSSLTPELEGATFMYKELIIR
jgi:ribosomal protein S18 acetylase RimI-like enzyme